MTSGLIDELKNAKRKDINNINSKLYKLNALKTKLRNCLIRVVVDLLAQRETLFPCIPLRSKKGY
jgi:hypothetical protein